jgi:hypothetical protein
LAWKLLPNLRKDTDGCSELFHTIDAVGIRNVPYVDYTTLWVEKQQAAVDDL